MFRRLLSEMQFNISYFYGFFYTEWHYCTLKKKYGCQHYIRVTWAVLYGSETDTSSIVIRALSFRHYSYSIGVSELN